MTSVKNRFIMRYILILVLFIVSIVLLSYGFIKGNEVGCVGKSALGDPRSYEIDGSVIAIRKMDAKNIVVR